MNTKIQISIPIFSESIECLDDSTAMASSFHLFPQQNFKEIMGFHLHENSIIS